jgi:hypothetical protein
MLNNPLLRKGTSLRPPCQRLGGGPTLEIGAPGAD